MVELVDTQVSEACGRKAVEVQVLFRAPRFLSNSLDFVARSLTCAAWAGHASAFASSRLANESARKRGQLRAKPAQGSSEILAVTP
jgi:hypothetical protein